VLEVRRGLFSGSPNEDSVHEDEVVRRRRNI
jgi:hypothetical protein